MADEPEKYVAEIVCAAGNRLVSRVRLQKIAYLLEQKGIQSCLNYSYHHYGPYSRDLDAAVLDAEAFDLVEENFDRRKSDGARYSIFSCKNTLDGYVYLNDETLRNHVRAWAEVPATVLELAATAHWLHEHEGIEDWRSEIIRRKGQKTEAGRLDKALELLRDVGLPPSL